MFIGRKKELKYLEDIYESNKAEFITIYGRRRIGKTEILKQFSKNKKCFFYSAKICTDYDQLLAFSEKIIGKGKKFESWESAFKHFINISSKDNKIVLILDEFPYMVKGNRGLPSIIQNLWDHELYKSNIMIILCGSSMSFMEKDILSEKNPLYGRMTGIYKIQELSLEESAEFFKKYSKEDIISTYSILGGVPYYLLQFDSCLNLYDNIYNNILNKGRILYNEVDLLIKQELREPQIYYTIVEKIAMGNTKLNEIYNKTLIDKNKIAVYLKNLIGLNIIKKEYPVTEKLKTKVNLHSGIYKLQNNYFDFYFRFVFPNISDLEEGDIGGVFKYEIEPNLNEYVSKNFENICISYLRKQNRLENLSFRIKEIGRWWDKNNEIDVVAYNKKGDYIFGECKWRNQKVGINVLNQLIKKSEDNFSAKLSEYYLFSKSGFTEELLTYEKNHSNVSLVNLDDII